MATVVDNRLNQKVNVDNLKVGDGFCYERQFYMKCTRITLENGTMCNTITCAGKFTTFCNCEVEPVNLIWSIK